jgi:dTDP-4-dehydrorhamnose 3,5-epimerase
VSRLEVTNLPLTGLKLVERRRLGDSRGFLARVFSADVLEAAGWAKPISQINHTYTAAAATVRGLHFQNAPFEEMKLVTCLRGEVLDVAVDIRRGSPTYLRWHGEKLSADNCRSLLIPEGFAHGYQTLTDDVELLYCHSAPYTPEAEAGLSARDPVLAITWPLPIGEMSPRDLGFAHLGEATTDLHS